VQSGKRDGGADAQLAGQTRVGTSGGELRFVGFLDRALRPLVEINGLS